MAYDRTWPLFVTLDNVDSPVTSCNDLDKLPPNEKQQVQIKVRGDYTIGQVMVATTNEIAINQDWTDFAFWWPKKKKWLKQTRMTLDQADVHANCELHFTTMHKMLRLQMPDLSIVEMSVDFSVNVLATVSQLCGTLPIRHAEELSLMRPLSRQQIKRNNPNLNVSPLQRPSTPTEKVKSPSRGNLSNGTLGNKSNGSQLNVSYGTISSNNSLNSSNYSLASPDVNRAALLRPKSALEKARLNSAWLNSSISLYEQDVCAYDLLLLKYKFFDFYDLNPKNDIARINYIYEQLKWAIICEEVNCTDDEMYTLAAINLQVALQSGGGRAFLSRPVNGTSLTINGGLNGANGVNGSNGSNGMSPSAYSYATIDSPKTNGFFRFNSINENGYTNGNRNGHNGHNGHNGYGNGFSNGFASNGTSEMSPVDEIDSALEDLEKTLEGTYIEAKGTNGYSNGKHMNGQHNILVVPELADKLKVNSQKGTATLSRFKFLNSEKSYFVLLKDTTLCVYKSLEQKEKQPDSPLFKLNINFCEVKPDVLASQRRFCFQIIETRHDGAVNHLIRCRDEEQYAKWFTACKQASIGRTMAHASYHDEVKKTLKLLQIQTSTKSPTSQHPPVDLDSLNIQLEEFVSPRLLKRKSREQILRKIKNVHSNFVNDSPIEAQMNFIKTCQSLRDYGITLFVIRFSKSKKEDLLGVAPNKLLLIDINNGSLLKSWRYSTLIDWNVNWEVKKMQINFNEEDIEFECLSADCKVIHEYIGGYIYLSMRSKDNDKLNEEEFLKLTGGWNELEQSADENQLRRDFD